MPSIPQSLLWISLVVLWLFVLVPMLISKRETVRRTSDVALATRVLNSGKSRLLKRRGPAAGHHHDPDWEPVGGGFENLDADDDVAAGGSRARSVVMVKSAAAVGEPELDYLDVDVVDDDSGALPVGGISVEEGQPSLFDQADEAVTERQPKVPSSAFGSDIEEEAAERDAGVAFEADPEASAAESEKLDGALDAADDYEYVDDSELETERAEAPVTRDATPRTSRSRRFESTTAAAVSARKYRFRKRVLMSMAVLMLFTAVLSFSMGSEMWWLCGTVTGVTVLYLGYLRRQTRIEAQVRRRRQQRMSRSRLGVENTQDREFDVVPSRLRRPGAAVLEIDDEDPVFEHLDEVAFARHYDLPRAAGQ